MKLTQYLFDSLQRDPKLRAALGEFLQAHRAAELERLAVAPEPQFMRVQGRVHMLTELVAVVTKPT